MSGWDWIREDRETAGEAVARCVHLDCRAPLELIVRDTLILERCSIGRHVAHCQLVYPESFCEA